MCVPVTLWKKWNSGVHVCVRHGWKGLEERNKLYKETHDLRIILSIQIVLQNFFVSAFNAPGNHYNNDPVVLDIHVFN